MTNHDTNTAVTSTWGALSRKSLIFFRIILGGLITINLVSLLPWVTFFFSDYGAFSRADVIANSSFGWLVSIFMSTGSPFLTLLLFILSIISAITFTLGIKTKLSNFILWFLLLSLHNRNPYILNAGDIYQRMLLFWALFLPLDNSSQSPKYNQSDVVNNVWTQVFIIQVIFLYFFAGIIKLFSGTWIDGTALYYALSSEIHTNIIATSLSKLDPTLLKIGTHLTIWIEIILPLILLIPKSKVSTRKLICIFFILFHLSIELLFRVGWYSFFAICAWIAIWPTRSKPSDEISTQSRSKIFPELIAAFLFVCLLLVNLSTISKFNIRIPQWLQYPISLVRLDQKWDMFELPIIRNGWLIAQGRFRSGDETNLLMPDYQANYAHQLASHGIKNERFRKMQQAVVFNKRNNWVLEAMSRYFCRKYSVNGSELDAIHFVYAYRDTLGQTKSKTPLASDILWRWECYEGKLTTNPPSPILIQ